MRRKKESGREFLRQLTVETLETRWLMAGDGPKLFGARPEQGELLTIGAVDVVHSSPNEIRLLFQGGADIDPATLAGGVRLTRSGFDDNFANGSVTITPAYLALGDNGANSNEIVMRFASVLPDDLYRLEVLGTATGLKNTSGDLFQPSGSLVDRDRIEFQLDLGAQAIAVVPQPITRVSGALQQAKDTVVVYFNNDDLNATLAGGATFYHLVDTKGTLTAADDQLYLPTAVTYSAATDSATLRFDNDNNAGTTYALPNSTWRLEVGQSDEPNGLTTNAVRVGALYNSASYTALSYLGDGNDTSTNASDVDLYRVSLKAGSSVTISVAPNAGLDVAVRLLRADGTTVVATTPTSTGGAGVTETLSNTAALPATEDYFVEVTGVASTVGGYRISLSTGSTLTLGENAGTPSDDDSSFTTANSVGVLGDASVSISATVSPPTLLLPQFPGANDEPSHRDITPDPHSGTYDLTAVASNGIETRYYNFAVVDPGNTDSSGVPFQNTITAEEKQVVREIYELYGAVTGMQFIEDTVGLQGTRIMVGDLRAADPSSVNGPGGVAGLGGGGIVVLDALEGWGADRKFGSGFFSVMLHEIGHSIGLGHSYDVPSVMGGDFTAEPVYPGDEDIVNLNRLHRPDNIDVDLYKFTLAADGRFTAEITAERQATSTLLDSVLRLYRENLDGTRELVAQNDDYFSDDSFLDLELEAGTYYIGVSSAGNDQYDPEVLNSGFGGRTQGAYDLRLNFTADTTRTLVDTTNTRFDGDSDGNAGGLFQFWFQTANTLFVDKLADTIPNVPQGTGALATPYDSISTAVAAATPGSIIRVVANGGTDGTLATLGDNKPYLIGYSNSNAPLADGTSLEVPAGVTLMVDAGAIVKMRLANIDVGTNDINVPRAAGALQVLGAPGTPVYFRSYRDDSIGGDSDGTSVGAAAGDYGGLVFRDDSDREAQGVFLNWVSHADMKNGGGKVFVGNNQTVFTPIHIESARPTLTHNTITASADAAISADPNSFLDTIAGNSNKRLHRYGPDIHGNTLSGNTVNGLFVRIETELGQSLDKLDVTGRFDDRDVVHVITENLEITGNAGGAVDNGAGPTARASGRLMIDPGVVVKLRGARIEAERGSAQLIAEGTEDKPIVITSLNDDKYGIGGTFDTGGDGSTTSPAAGDWSGLIFNHVSSGSLDHVVLSYAGGKSEIAGAFADFAPIEVQQATVRIANSTLENNADGADGGRRDGRMGNVGSTIFVRGAQPVIVDNVIRDNEGPAIDINTNSLNAFSRKDPGRSTGEADRYDQFDDNYGPLVRLNRMENNATNGMEIRSDEYTTEGIWDDTDIVHVVRDEIGVALTQNHHSYSDLWLRSTPTQSLVVKLSGGNAGFTVNGELHELDDRIGGAVHLMGSPGHPVVLTGLTDCTVGAGFTPDGKPMNDTIPGGNCGTSVVTVAPPFADVLVVIDESSSMGPLQDFTEQMIPALEAGFVAAGIGTGGTGTNNYGLVGYGGSDNHRPNGAPSADTHLVGGALWGSAVDYVTAAQTLQTQSGAADGYKGLDFALANYSFRGNAAKFIILITDTNRESFFGSGLSPSTSASLLAQMSARGITLQTIVNATFEDGAGNPAIAVDASSTAYLPDGAGGYTTGAGGVVVTQARPNIKRDYIDLGWATGGISGDLQPIAAGGNDQLSFTAAFVDSIVAQSQTVDTTNPGEWRSVRLDQYSNDRNVAAIGERETSYTEGNDVNNAPIIAQPLGVLAPDEKSGDENRRLGFEVLGSIAYDSPSDKDVYSFTGAAGSRVWIDIDRTDSTLDTKVELITFAGGVTAGSDDSLNGATLTGTAQTMFQNVFLSEDNYSINPKDAGFSAILPGTAGQKGTYFVRVSSDGKTSGNYQLQVRLRQQDEEPGSSIQYSDIRNATTGIEVIGLPARSNLAGEAGENGDASGNSAAAQDLGNLLQSDRNVVSVAGSLTNAADVDFYKIGLTVQQIQRIGGVNANTTIQWPLVFDVDYADGLVRPDSTFSVFDAQGRLILVGRESNVADDQPASSATLSLDDLSRGTVGKQDPFIGPVVMNEGTNYTFAVTSTQQMPIQLDQYANMTPVNSLVRLEPIESVQRVVEDHVGTSGYVAANGVPIAPSNQVFDIDTKLTLDTHIVPFTFDDVRLFVSNDTQIFTLDSQSGNNLATVGAAGTTNNRLRDIVIRSDGRLFGYRDNDSDTTAADNDVGDVAGTLINYDPGNAGILSQQNDGIRGPVAGTAFGPNNGSAPTTAADVTYTDGVEALTFQRLASGDYDLYYSVSDPVAGLPPGAGATGYSKLFVDPDGPLPDGAVSTTATNRGFVGYIGGALRAQATQAINGAGITFIANRAGTAGNGTVLTVQQDPGSSTGNIGNGLNVAVVGASIVVTVFNDGGNRSLSAQQLVDAINANAAARALGTAQLDSNPGNRISTGTGTPPNPLVPTVVWNAVGGVNGTLVGRTTGMAFVENTLYGVSDAGEFFTINTSNASATVLRTYAGISFSGLALGPQNLDANRDATIDFARHLFAIDSTGTLRAINTTSVASNPQVFGPVGGPLAATLATGVANPTGLAFSNLDFNLWHPTDQRGAADVAGHGINTPFNNSRPAVAGGTSFYFGLDAGGYLTYDVLGGAGLADGQYGATAQTQADLLTNAAISNTYNLPGGAKGKLLTDSFSLSGYSRFDKPTLYFNYLLDTEGANGAMWDSARAFISDDGGVTWDLVASNNSLRGNEIAPTFTHDATSNPAADPNSDPNTLQNSDILAQQVQELFDSNTWRQARIDLSGYAGQSDLRLRFDFATAGAIDEVGLPGEQNGVVASAQRGQNNQRAGFFVDDILVGFAERGELVTAARADDTRMTATNSLSPEAPTPQLAGAYQVEVRPGADYGGNTVTYNALGVNRTFDTNDRLVQEDAATGTTPSDSFNRAALRTTTSLPWQTGGFSDWIISANRANANLSTIGTFDPNDLANSEFTMLQISLETQAGNVAFTEFSTLADSIFFIDGVNVDGVMAGGAPVNGAQTYAVSAGLHTYTWIGAKATALGFESSAIDNVTFPGAIVGTGDKGDDNYFREQGQLIISDNKISSSLNYGIDVTAGTRDTTQSLPHPGVPINFNTQNTNRWVPGVVISNNILDSNETAAIRFGGDNTGNPLAVVPFGRIVNNTIYGGASPNGTGVIVRNNASPTILNNIFANTNTAISTAGAGTVVIASNLFHNNGTPTTAADPLAGTDPLFGLDTDPLFNSSAKGRFYPATGSLAIDSSLETLQDRAAFWTVKQPLGIPQSPIFAPDYDLYGQLRQDDPNADPLGGGSSIFKDRGAVESADIVGPYAELIDPVDGDSSDFDPNSTVVFRRSGLLTRFAILLSDGPGAPFANEGTGVDPTTVWNKNTGLSSTVVLKRDGVVLTANVDYSLGYSENDQTLLLQPLSEVWEPNHVYEITLENQDPVLSITDYAGNILRANQPDGAVRFTIILGDLTVDFGDLAATIAGNATTFPTTLAQDGARHVQIPTAPLYLGSRIDTEEDAIQTSTADSDDRTFVLSFSTVPASTLTLTSPPATFQIPAGSGASTVGVTDGETITINDQVHPPVVIEIDLNGVLNNASAARVSVNNSRDSASDVAAAIVDAIQSKIDAGALRDVRPRSTGDTVTLQQFGVDDEDGVDFSKAVFNEKTNVTDLTITSSGAGFVDAWIDFNNDGTFQSTEQILTSHAVIAGANAIALNNITPVGSFIGQVNARFRVSPFGGLTPGGVVPGGEVEDYLVTILPGTPPVAVADNYSVNEDASLSVPAKGVLTNDTDVDLATDPVIALLVSGPTHAVSGSFVLNADGSFTYTPQPDFYGTDTFVYRAQDSVGLISNNRATVTITVNPVNDAPVNAVPATQTTLEDVTLTFSTANSNAISLADDAAANPVQVTLAVGSGALTLGSTSGLSFSFSDGNGTGAGDGSGDATMTFRGSLTNINAALQGLVYSPPLDFNGSTTLVITTNDLGNVGGGSLTDVDTVTINVTAVNDAPVTSAPTTLQVTDEDVPLVFNLANGNRVSIADDSLASPIKVTLTATNGVVTLGALSGLGFLAGDGASDATMTFTGSLTDVNAALNNLTFVSPADYNGVASIVISVDDQGATGIGGALTDLDTISIAVAAVNDAPVNTVPGSQTVAEDVTLVFSSALARQISVADLESGSGGNVQVTLAATNGAVSLNGVAGLTFSVGDGTADPTMTFTGTVATINSRLNGLQFRPNNNFDGTATLVVTTNDLGTTGKGGPLTDTDTVTITVTPVNDAPVNVVPAAQSVAEDVALVFSTAGGNALGVTDDAGTNPIKVTLSATNGTYTLGSFTGLSFQTGDGTADATTVFTGTLADVNAALQGLSFLPPLNFSGTSRLAITTDDQGNTGAGSAQSDTDTVTITVNAVNDAPVNSIPGTQTTDDEVSVVFNTANSNRITISDVDAGANVVRVSLAATSGVVTLPTLSGLSFTVGDGTSDVNMSFTGTVANINTALNGLIFRPDDFFIGNAFLAITTNDLGNTGSGGQQTDSDTVTINVLSVNDPPVNTVPGTQTTAEDVPLWFGSGAGNAITTIDDALTLPIEVKLVATNGVLTLGGTTAGLTFIAGSGTSDATFTVQGKYADINAALDMLRFDPTPNFNGTATIAMRTDDLGHSGAGSGSLVTTSTVTVNVTAVNDAPVNAVPGAQAVLEDTLLTLGGATKISVSDVDATQLQVTLAASGGTVTLNGVVGLTFTAGDGVDDAVTTFRGTPAAVNTALDGLTFSPGNNTNGSAQLVVTSSDLGGTGSGGTKTDVDTVAITVTPVNDAPTYVLPAGQTVAEDGTLTLSSAGGNAISVVDDAGTNPVRVTLSTSNGTVALAGVSGLTFVIGDGSAASTMTFSGTLTDVNAALNGLVYKPSADFSGTATISLSTDDLGNTGLGGALTGVGTVTVTVTGVNDAPVNTVPGAQSTPEDVGLTFSSGLGNQIAVSDIDAGSNSVRVTLAATNGTMTLSTLAGLTFSAGDGTADATMTFTGALSAVNAALNGAVFNAPANYFGPASVQIASNDLGNTGAGAALGDTDTVAITVTSVNDPPIASPTPRSTSEDTALTISGTSLTANDVPGPTNEAGQTLVLSSVTSPSAQGGTVTLAAGQVVYTPAANFNGTDTFTYLIVDNGTTNGVSEPKSAFGTVTVTVSPVNDAPTAVNDNYVMNEDTTLVRSALLGVLANDVDPDSSSLVATRISGPTTGTLSLATDGSFTYLPPANFFGVATFTYRVSDGQLNSNTATVTITVNDVNEPPIANNDTASTTKNAAVNIVVLANDTDVDGTLAASTVQVTSSPAHGTVAVQANGTITYTPAADYQGADLFQYTVRDNAGDISNVATVNVTVGPAPPVWQNQTNHLDVNNDTFVSPIDPLQIINKLNEEGPSELPIPAPVPIPAYYDVNGDGFIAPNDANIVITALNEGSAGEGEGEDPWQGYVFSPVTLDTLTVVEGNVYAYGASEAASQAREEVFAGAATIDPEFSQELSADFELSEDFIRKNEITNDAIDDAFAELWGE